MTSFYDNMTNRTRLIVGEEKLERLSESKIIVIGVGGVGSWCAEALIRSGVRYLTVVDSDIVCETNINRQAEALFENVGKIKVEEMKKRLLAIHPDAHITAINSVYTEETASDFCIESYDYVVDAIDSLKHKCFLISECQRLNKKFISSMGAAAKIDASKIKLAKLSSTTNCSLARAVRQRLRKSGVSTDFLCVYSSELPVKQAEKSLCHSEGCVCSNDRSFATTSGDTAIDRCSIKKQINGSLVHITAIFGFTIAGQIIRDICQDQA